MKGPLPAPLSHTPFAGKYCGAGSCSGDVRGPASLMPSICERVGSTLGGPFSVAVAVIVTGEEVERRFME